MDELSGRVVVITGASSGIGRASAAAFAREGARVVLAARSADGLEVVRAECAALGAEALGVPTDVRDEAAVDRLADAAVERFGALDVWVSCAGVMAYGRFEDVPSEVFRAAVETNFMGQVHSARAALRAFRRQGRGQLVCMGSLWARVATPEVSSYVTGKFAVRALAECLHQELRHERDIGVSLIHPQAVDTPIFARAGNYAGREPRAVPPVLTPEDIAQTVVACARSPRREVTVRWLARALELVHDAAPPVWQRVLPTAFETGNYGPRTVAPNPGNVLEAVPGDRSTHGGWRTGRKRTLATAFAQTAAGGVRGLFRG